MSDIFREVDEALQQEKLAKIWADNKSTIIAAIAILILSTLAATAYRNWDASRDAKETARLMEAMESAKPQQALQEILKDTRNGHEALGLMISAGLLVDEDKPQEAAALYKQAAENRSTPKNLRDLARILYNQHAAEPNLEILQPLLANDKSPWIWHARLQAAVITRQSASDTSGALEYLEPFKNAAAIPVSLQQRAEAIEHVYRLKQIAPAAGDEE